MGGVAEKSVKYLFTPPIFSVDNLKISKNQSDVRHISAKKQRTF